jgi:hypothetical protein
MVKEMCKYKIDICAVQEIRWPGERNCDKKVILYDIFWT